MIQNASKIYQEYGILELIPRIVKRSILTIFDMNSAIWHVRWLYLNEVKIEASIPVTMHFFEFNKTLDWIKRQNKPWMINKNEEAVAKREEHYWPHITYNGMIIGYIKCGFNDVFINDFKKIIKFPPNVAFIYDTFTLKEFRCRRVASHLINETCGFLKTRGFTKVMCHIPEGNIASENAYSNVGFTKLKKIRWLRIFGLKILTANPSHL